MQRITILPSRFTKHLFYVFIFFECFICLCAFIEYLFFWNNISNSQMKHRGQKYFSNFLRVKMKLLHFRASVVVDLWCRYNNDHFVCSVDLHVRECVRMTHLRRQSHESGSVLCFIFTLGKIRNSFCLWCFKCGFTISKLSFEVN